MAQASKQLQADIERALKLKQKADDMQAEAKAAAEIVYAEMEAEGLLDPDTKAIGNVRTVVSPNRFFDEAKARELFKPAVLKQAEVKKIDGAILKRLVAPADYEQCMAYYPKKFKLGLKVND